MAGRSGASTWSVAGAPVGPTRRSTSRRRIGHRRDPRKRVTPRATAPGRAASGGCGSRRTPAARAQATASAHSLYESLQSDSCTAEEALAALSAAPLEALMGEAALLRDRGHRHITFSAKVFIPLTRLCRDRWAWYP